MKSRQLFSIKFVSIQTGLTPHLIRAWEGRYRAVAPKRTQTNRRQYCQEDIHRLKLLKLAIDAGHQISQIAGANTDELRQLLATSGVRSNVSRAESVPAPGGKTPAKRYLKECLQAAVELAPERLEKTLSIAAIHLTRKKLIEDLITPLFHAIGDLWSSGNLKILNEHVASLCVRTILADMLRSVEVSACAPSIVVGTPVGQWHELGALAAALASAEAGWRPIYVGANLPAEELASAIEHFDAKCIGLSMSHPLDDHRLRPELLKLRRYMRSDRYILIGGLREAWRDDLIDLVEARRMDSWQDFVQTLKLLAIE